MGERKCVWMQAIRHNTCYRTLEADTFCHMREPGADPHPPRKRSLFRLLTSHTKMRHIRESEFCTERSVGKLWEFRRRSALVLDFERRASGFPEAIPAEDGVLSVWRVEMNRRNSRFAAVFAFKWAERTRRGFSFFHGRHSVFSV